MTSKPPSQDLPADKARAYLDRIDLFAKLTVAERTDLARTLVLKAIARGEHLVRQGEEAHALYVVVSGRFEVRLDGRSDAVTELGPGAPIGEVAFLTGGGRTATVTALRDSLVLRLDRAPFEDLAARHPPIWRSLALTLASRLADGQVTAQLRERGQPRTIAIMHAGLNPMHEEARDKLIATFRAHARCAVLTSESHGDMLGREGPLNDLDDLDITHALNALEQDCDYVLYLADPTLTPWSQRALRQADLVIMIARHRVPGLFTIERNPLEDFALALHPPEHLRLLLVHRRQRPVQGTARWLLHRAIGLHHHVALDRDDDFDRVLRFIDGTAIGLVASGGGAFCAMHVGVYQALLERGIKVDMFGGTSGGAAMTAAFAMGGTPDEIDAQVHEMFVENHAMRYITWPRYSLLDHTFLDAQLQVQFGQQRIEDMWLPFFAVSTNLSRFALEVHRNGVLWQAIRASSAIPALLPPFYTDDGEMLADGALIDNTPLSTMHRLKSGPNIISGFQVAEDERFNVAYDALPSRATLLGQLINPMRRAPQAPVAPGIGDVLARALMANRKPIASVLKETDLFLSPAQPQDVSILDWSQHTRLKAIGYEWTRARLDDLNAEQQALLGLSEKGAPVDMAAVDPV
ncbi:MAG: patatin-like phospholipase family protein [Pseudomonadota bacterium]